MRFQNLAWLTTTQNGIPTNEGRGQQSKAWQGKARQGMARQDKGRRGSGEQGRPDNHFTNNKTCMYNIMHSPGLKPGHLLAFSICSASYPLDHEPFCITWWGGRGGAWGGLEGRSGSPPCHSLHLSPATATPRPPRQGNKAVQGKAMQGSCIAHIESVICFGGCVILS